MINDIKMVYGLVLIICFLLLPQLEGCSVVGYTVGAMADNAKPDSLYLSAWETNRIESGRDVMVTLRNGKQIGGKYLGICRLPQKEYANRYDDCRLQHQDTVFLPTLGSSIHVTLKSGIKGEREFEGFDWKENHAELKPGVAASSMLLTPVLLVKSKTDTTSGAVLLKDIEKVEDTRGNVIEGEVLLRLSFESQIPLRSAIIIQNLEDTVRVGADRIWQIELKNKKNARLWPWYWRSS